MIFYVNVYTIPIYYIIITSKPKAHDTFFQQVYTTLSINKIVYKFDIHLSINNAHNDLARATFIELATFIINSECDRMIHT